MGAYCVMTEVRLVKNPNTKTTYIEEERTTETIDEQKYRRIVSNETLRFFRRLGGTETAERNYTCRGYNVVKLTSTSPDRSKKIVRTFKFIY